ncbi:sodium-coupled monocarboxylate transporter 1-like isoform X2 [Zootermopsis nevadensis]|nr:sodium-coupled monocarboxylate transporter 1-like isoform X2 [Zootermopsis nevadensis]
METVQEVRYFSWVDYTVFGAMLLGSVAIGLYHGCNGRFTRDKNSGPTRSDSGEFLTANGQMGPIPVAVSMLAGFLSSITLMGQPAEVYLFGPQLWMFGLSSFVCIPIIGYIFIPFYHKMQYTSAYKYFGQRFNRWLQLFASAMFSIQMVIYLALVLYAPALALQQVTGLDTNTVVTMMYIVVILYTTVGGIKAVIWTDCFQVLILYSSMFGVLVKGTIDVGGLAVVWERNVQSGRSDFFNWSIDPTERYTLWGSLIGSAFLHVSVYGANQLQVQRYRTVATIEQARQMIWINTFGWTVVVILTVYAGMLIFARYYDCDPLSSGVLSKPDQLFPLYVMDSLGDYVGFPGLFVAGIFSAGLSTVSTGLNSLAAIWWAELDETALKESLSQRRSGLTVKFLALFFGLLSYALVYVVPYMGGLVPVAISLSSFFSGSFLGLFILGIFVPWANTAGAACGLTVGIGAVGWLAVGAQMMSDKGQAIYTPLPLSTEGCSIVNTTVLADDSK